MFEVTVRDHVMVAHSFRGDVFGPAQRLHGATFVVDATFCGAGLDDDGLLVDIGWARDRLRDVLSDLDYRNLDDEADFAGRNTTSEVLAQVVADRLVVGLPNPQVTGLRVTLHESHVAWASYARDVSP